MKIDLHSHTTASDGTYSPTALLDIAKERGIDLFAMTDHDTIAGFLDARAYADSLGIRLVSGVEISTLHTLVGGYGTKQQLTKGIHIVGLNFHHFEKMQARLDAVQIARAGRGRAIVDKMADILANTPTLLTSVGDVDLTDAFLSDDERASWLAERLWTAVLAKADNNAKAVGRPHIAQVLCDWGVVASVSQAFDKYLGDDKPAYVALECLSMEQAITLIHDCGGLAVLAHPTRYGLSATRVRKLVGEFAELGGDACELPNFGEPVSTRKMIDKEIARYHLLVSVGSDYHGTITPWRKLGDVPALAVGQTGVWERF